MHGRAQRVERITAIFEQRLGIHVPGADTDLFAAGAVDSLSFINLLLQLELEFDLTIPLAHLDLEQFNTVNRIAAYVDHAIGETSRCGPRVLSSAR